MSLSINGAFNSFKSFATESFEAAKEQAGFVAKSTAEAAEEVLIKDPVEFFTGKKDATPKDAAILYAAATVPYLTVPFGCGGADATDKCGGDQTGIKLNGSITYAYVNADGTLSPIDNKYQIIGNRTIRISINAEDCSGASDGLNAIFTINGKDYAATRSGSVFYVDYPCKKMEEIKGTITLVDPDFDPDVRRTENIDGSAGAPIINLRGAVTYSLAGDPESQLDPYSILIGEEIVLSVSAEDLIHPDLPLKAIFTIDGIEYPAEVSTDGKSFSVSHKFDNKGNFGGTVRIFAEGFEDAAVILEINGAAGSPIINQDGGVIISDSNNPEIPVNPYKIKVGSTVRFGIHASIAKRPDLSLRASFMLNGQEYQATQDGNLFYVDYPISARGSIAGNVKVFVPGFEADALIKPIDASATSSVTIVDSAVQFLSAGDPPRQINPYDIVEGETLQLKILVESIDGDMEGLSATFTINGETVLATREGNAFIIEHTFDSLGNFAGNVRITNASDEDTVDPINFAGSVGAPITNAAYTVIDAVDNPQYVIARRPVTLRASYTRSERLVSEGIAHQINWTIIPKDLNIDRNAIIAIFGEEDNSWQQFFMQNAQGTLSFDVEHIIANIQANQDIDQEKTAQLITLVGTLITEATPTLTQNGDLVVFTPPVQGVYAVNLQISTSLDDDVFSRPLNDLIVNQFSASTVKLNGPTTVFSGNVAQYGVQLTAPAGRGWGTEDDNASCRWTMDPALAILPSRELAQEVTQPCSQPIQVAYPLTAANVNYHINVTATGAENSYRADDIINPTLYPYNFPAADVISVDGSPDGILVGRPVTLTFVLPASAQELEPPIGDVLSVDWVVKKSGSDQEIHLSGESPDFTPLEDGVYEYTATVTCSNGVFTVRGTFRVEDLAPPSIIVEGDEWVTEGSTETYRLSITPSEWRPLGPEDDAAICTVTLRSNRNNQVIGDPIQLASCRDSFPLAFPLLSAGNDEEVYHIEVTMSADGYERAARTTKTIHVQSSAVVEENPELGFDVSLDNPYPYILKTLSAKRIDRANGYRWEIIEVDNVPKDTPELMAEGPNNVIQYRFPSDGTYKIRLTYTFTDAEGVTTDVEQVVDDLILYPFPEPTVNINANQNAAIHAGQPANFFAQLAGEEIAVDSKVYEWHFGSVTTDPAGRQVFDPTGMDQYCQDLNAINPICNFLEAAVVTAALTVTGLINGEEAYSITGSKTIDVWPGAIAALPHAAMVIPDHAIYGEETLFTAINADDNYNYTWDMGDGNPPITRADNPNHPNIRYTYLADSGQIGNYPVSLTITDPNTGAVIDSLTQNITVVPAGGAGSVVPAFTVHIPDYAPMGTDVPFSISFPENQEGINPDEWDVEWSFGDGFETTVPVNQELIHQFDAAGITSINYALVNRETGARIEAPTPRSIQIGNIGTPVVSILFNNGNYGGTPFDPGLEIGYALPEGISVDMIEGIKYKVQWGDDPTDIDYVDEYFTSQPTHTYEVAGTYTLRVVVEITLVGGEVIKSGPIPGTVSPYSG